MTTPKDPMSHAQTDQIMRFFKASHLPPPLRAVSEPFGDLACTVCETLPRNAERTVALRKLLEAKDAAVRALVFEAYTESSPSDPPSAALKPT